ncbi:MAG: carotenoid biosynthesis protein [Candidatus Methylomirabilales bacterium]
MSDVPRLLLGSLLLRPYVFAFLLLHLLGVSALLGWRRTAGFTMITWGVALAAEHCSIRTGIPFGWYYYIPRTADRELWIAGVPFFDSLSFTFLLVASYGLGWFLLAGARPSERPAFVLEAKEPGALPRPGRARHLILASLLFVLIDVIIDPVALRGDRWFLGQIYGYPEPGVYFGVPLANFLGWGVVGGTATALYHIWERRRPAMVVADFDGWAALCPGLYFIVLVFNLAVTFVLGEWRLLLSGMLLTLPVLLWTLTHLMRPRPLVWRPRAEGRRA